MNIIILASGYFYQQEGSNAVVLPALRMTNNYLLSQLLIALTNFFCTGLDRKQLQLLFLIVHRVITHRISDLH